MKYIMIKKEGINMAKGCSGNTHTQQQLNNYSDQNNPNNQAHQANNDNHANQCNPNNENYQGHGK